MGSDQTKEQRTGRMTRLSDIIVGRVLPGIRRRHEEFSAAASSDSSADGEKGAATGTYTPAAASGRRGVAADQGESELGPASRRPNLKRDAGAGHVRSAMHASERGEFRSAALAAYGRTAARQGAPSGPAGPLG